MSRTRNLGNLTDLLTAGSTYVTGTTPPQFDNSGILATTAFVQRASGNMSGATGYGSPGGLTLTAANCGSLIDLISGYSGTILLPLSSSVTQGSTITIYNGSVGSVTLSRQGSDTIYANNNSNTSVTISRGDSIQIVLVGNAWIIWGGAAQLPYSNLFSSNISTSGYQKLPSGLIVQWGLTSAVNSGATLGVTFPLAFPNATYSVVLTYVNSISSVPSSGAPYMVSLYSSTGFNLTNGGSGSSQYFYSALGT